MDLFKMGRVSRIKIFMVIASLVLTAFAVYAKPETKEIRPAQRLDSALKNIGEWQGNGFNHLNGNIVASLKLDDYLNKTYTSRYGQVSLYIGYYRSSEKVGAAHSPLVCFPGQGWILSDGVKKTVTVGNNKINLRQMVATIGPRKELVLYWFQAYEKTSPGTFLQKVYTLFARYAHGRADNAFVRITVPMNNMDEDAAYAIGDKFIKSFYPRFFAYIKS